MSASKKIYSLMAAALVFGVVGCGGSGSNPTVDPTEPVNVNGGVQQNQGGLENTLPASANEQLVTVLVDNQDVEAVVPPSTNSAPAGTPLAVFRANVPIIEGLEVEGAAESLTRSGTIIVNGQVLNGVRLTRLGRLSRALAFLPGAIGAQQGRYDVLFQGPMRIRRGNRFLTIQQIRLNFLVNANGVASVPVSLTGKLPVNGGSTLASTGAFVSFTVPQDYDGQEANLTITKSNGDLSKTVLIQGNGGTFNDLFPGNHPIPANGVNEVRWTFAP